MGIHLTGRILTDMPRAYSRKDRHARVIDNAQLNGLDLENACDTDSECWSLLENAAERFNLSARAHQRVLRVARTIADLAGHNKIEPPQIAEALSLRCLDRQL